ncbi:hypothetical protein SUGI_0463390 [Cryptomeria japonica]|nr:hypothetical protein SUGI_0463390 [Cryptomeria japonica]
MIEGTLYKTYEEGHNDWLMTVGHFVTGLKWLPVNLSFPIVDLIIIIFFRGRLRGRRNTSSKGIIHFREKIYWIWLERS